MNSLPNQRVVVSIGWQRVSPQFGCVFSMHAVSCTVQQLPEVLDADRTTKRGNRVDHVYEGASAHALRSGEYTLYSDLADFCHPLLRHPNHPLHDRATKAGFSARVDRSDAAIPAV